MAVAGMTGSAVDLLGALAGAIVACAAVACARAWMARTADLNISLFRPWRGDPWPVGVQEDDDFRFTWIAPSGGTAIAGPPTGRGATRPPQDGSNTDASFSSRLEDVPDGSVAVERLGRINVRRFGR